MGRFAGDKPSHGGDHPQFPSEKTPARPSESVDMTRRKGERTAHNNERVCPFKVELQMPLGGLGKTLDMIHAFHCERGLDIRRGRGQRRDDQDYVRWCFADLADAEAFGKTFGGVSINGQSRLE